MLFILRGKHGLNTRLIRQETVIKPVANSEINPSGRAANPIPHVHRGGFAMLQQGFEENNEKSKFRELFSKSARDGLPNGSCDVGSSRVAAVS